MKKILCSYSTIEFKKSLDLLEKTANEIGQVDKTYMYNRDWLESTEFYQKNRYLLSEPKGAGYWIWKLPAILNTLEILDEGDSVMYVDAGIKVIDNLDSLFQIIEKKSDGKPVFFKLPAVGVPHHLIKEWTRKDTFAIMGADEPKYWNSNMVNAAISIWKKNEYTLDFLKEYQKYICDVRVIADGPNLKNSIFKIMSENNYIVVKDNVCCQRGPFEDWYVHKDFLNDRYGK